MNSNRAVAAIVATILTVGVVAGCAAQAEDDDCRSHDSAVPVIMFFGTDGHYHYGSPKGKVVPASAVPAEARKVSGYKPPAAPPKPAPKVDLNKPKPAAPAPRPAAPRVGGRR